MNEYDRLDGSKNWKGIREAWLRKRILRKCEKCGKEYLPNNAIQKFCENCSASIKERKHPSICSNCGRHIQHTGRAFDPKETRLCSFCFQAERQIIVQKQIEAKEGVRKKRKLSGSGFVCRMCGVQITQNEKEMFEEKCSTCFYRCHGEEVCTP